MNRRLLAPAIVLSVLCSGCGTFWQIAAQNLVEGPLTAASDHIRHKRLINEATKAYHEFLCEHPDDPPSDDFGLGFVDGFVDYVESGGNGEAPPNPPWRYSRAQYDSPGRQALLEYQNGFRKGSAVAIDSGLRDFIVMHPGQGPAPATDPDQRRRPNTDTGAKPDPMLPAPRMEPADGAADTDTDTQPEN